MTRWPRDENGNPNRSSRPGFAIFQPQQCHSVSPVQRKSETSAKYIPYKVHFPSLPENEEDTSLKRQLTPLQATAHIPRIGSLPTVTNHILKTSNP